MNSPSHEQDTIVSRTFDSPVGPLRARACGGLLLELSFRERLRADGRTSNDNDGLSERILYATEVQIGEYFAGRRTHFDLPLSLRGPEFNRRVWGQLLKIPYGKTVSYGQLAADLGLPGGARAVGVANGANPVAIVVPCHRVIGADGRLVGYGGGLHRKRLLLDLESGRVPLELS